VVGLMFLPIVFAPFTFRPGYSPLTKVVSLAWTLVWAWLVVSWAAAIFFYLAFTLRDPIPDHLTYPNHAPRIESTQSPAEVR
jgi:hypothetical protein